DDSRVAAIRARPAPDGQPLRTPFDATRPDGPRTVTPTERVGLVLPTSLCSSQIARLAAERMNANGLAAELGLSRFVALPHTEGCGFGGELLHRTLQRTYRGYATHPNVVAALLLEHGCEKVPNDAMRRQFTGAGIATDRFGWASVQLDGGIDAALTKVEGWFRGRAGEVKNVHSAPAADGRLNVGLLSAATPTTAARRAALALVEQVIAGGGAVLLAEGDPL